MSPRVLPDAGSLCVSFAASVAPTWPLLLVARALVGVALAGVPAVSLTYIGEEVDRGSIGLAVGLQIGGNVFGGMAGRLAFAFLHDGHIVGRCMSSLPIATSHICRLLMAPGAEFVGSLATGYLQSRHQGRD